MKSEAILYTGLSALQKKYYKAILMKDLGTVMSSLIPRGEPGNEATFPAPVVCHKNTIQISIGWEEGYR